ncbi:hypothetical protein LV78_005315 [Actinosynnema pretiosum]|nr:hypothetical protein [Actinosynnema pretiosum]
MAATAAVACALEAPDSYAVTGLMNARDILTEADLVYDGDTVMVLAVSRPTATGQDITWDLVWVGDCVAWLVNSTGVTRLTTPHTEGQQLHELGWPEFHASQHDNIVLTTVGTADRLPHGNATVTTGTGRLILASDGIGDLAKQQGLKSLCTDVVDPQACAQLLVERSTEHLHADNATAMVIDLVSRH